MGPTCLWFILPARHLLWPPFGPRLQLTLWKWKMTANTALQGVCECDSSLYWVKSHCTFDPLLGEVEIITPKCNEMTPKYNEMDLYIYTVYTLPSNQHGSGVWPLAL